MVILEYAFGRQSRATPINTFHKYLGGNGAWKGAFIIFVQIAVSSYYIVVCSWGRDFLIYFYFRKFKLGQKVLRQFLKNGRKYVA